MTTPDKLFKQGNIASVLYIQNTRDGKKNWIPTRYYNSHVPNKQIKFSFIRKLTIYCLVVLSPSPYCQQFYFDPS